jgi:hypothetical protein
MERLASTESAFLDWRRVRPMRGVRVRRRGVSVDSAVSTAFAASVPVLFWSSVMIKNNPFKISPALWYPLAGGIKIFF